MNQETSTSGGQGEPIRNRVVWAILLVVLLGITAAFAVKSFREVQREISKPLPVLGQLPEFELTERSGKPFGSRDLKGKAWVADFVFTSCAGPCPEMSAKMAKLQETFAGTSGLKCVSFSVDPEHDTPEVLREYAGRFHANEGQWFFLTGKTDAIYKLARESFKVSVERGDKGQTDPGNAIMHSVYFMLVDGRGRIRGYYNSTDPEAGNRLLREAPALLREK